MIRLSTILMLSFLVLALGPLGVVATLNFHQARSSLHRTIATELRTTADNRARQVEDYLAERRADVTVLAKSPTVIEAMGPLTTAFRKEGLAGPAYRTLDNHLRPYLSTQQALGFRDVLLLSLAGDVVFSVRRDRDRGSNVKVGPYRDSPLARAFAAAVQARQTTMSPFAPYPPDNEAASFLAVPIEKEGVIVGVLALRLDTRRISDLVNDHAGLGRTGEVVIGQRMDHEVVFLTPTRRDPEAAFRRRISLADPTSPPLARAMKGENGEGKSQDYLGHAVWAVWRHLPNADWALVVKIDEAEAFAPIEEMKAQGMTVAGLASLVVLAAAIAMARVLGRPLGKLGEAAARLARGEQSIPPVRSRVVELRDLARAFDLMARQVAERTAELAAHEAKLEAILDHAPAVIVVRGLQGQYLFVNRRFEQLFHVSRQGVLGKTDHDFFSHEFADVFRANDRAALSTGTAQAEEIVPHDDGPHTYLSVKFPLADASGQVYAVCGIATDITDRRKAEEALRQLNAELEARVRQRTAELEQSNAALRASEERVRLLLNSTGDAIYGVDLRGNCTICNPACAHLLGIDDPQTLLGRNMHALMHHTRPDGSPYPEAECRIYQAFRLGQATRADDEVFWRADGTSFPVEYRSNPLHLGDQVVGAVVTFTDLTERRRAEEALRQSEDRFRNAFDHAPIGMALVSQQGNWLQVNEALCKITGYSAEEMLGMTVQDITHPDDLEADLAFVRQMIAAERSYYRMEKRYLRKDGQIVWVVLGVARAHNNYSKPLTFVAQVEDISDRKRAEELLANRARLSAVTAEVGIALTQEGGLRDLLQRCTDALVRHLDVAFARIWALNHQEPVLELQASSGLYTHIDGAHARVPVGQFKIGRIAQERKAHLTNQVIGDPRVHDQEWARREGMVAFAGHPLIVGGQLCGVMALFARKPLLQATLDVLATVADEVALGITRIWSQQALRASEESLRTITDTALDAVILMDSAGRVQHWNPAAQRIFGYTRDEMLGHDLHQALAPERYREQASKGLAHFRETGQGPVIGTLQELQAMRKDGSTFPIELSVAAVRVGGGWTVVGVLRDITERKRAEGELRRAKEVAEAASLAKSEFLANMSHEIRTPLNGILGMTELLLDTELSPSQRDYLQVARDSGDTLLRVINDVLDFSKIEASLLDFVEEDFSLEEMLGQTMKTLALRAHQKGLELAYHVAADVPDGLAGDPDRLRQVLVNLVGNALKFTDQGEVAVSVEVASAASEGRKPPEPASGGRKPPEPASGGRKPPESAFPESASPEPAPSEQLAATQGAYAPRSPEVTLHFSVRDTGPGIPADQQQRIFGAFTQADMSVSRRHGGTGLGLSISAHLVERMGGRIWLDSAPGQGSTFHFTARFRLAGDPEVGRHPEVPVKLHGLPVLIADDNATNRRILHDLLSRWHVQPTAVAGGPEALAALAAACAAGEPFALALFDVNMPDMDGFTLAGRIKQQPDLAALPIILLSSADQAGSAARCRDLGIDRYLVKPVRPTELLDAISRVLRISDHRRRRPAVAPPPVAAPQRRLRILLAEDNPVNQLVAGQMLQKQGHTPVIATDGQQALDLLAGQPFDLVLMDVQMPGMDGYAATRALRRQERGTGRHLPVIAMTAHAMRGAREACLAAGMDEYLCKPLTAHDLYQAIARVLGSTPVPPAPPAPTEQAGQGSIEAVLADLGGDRELLGHMIRAFLQQCPGLLADIRAALARQDAPTLERAAHKLKGSLGHFRAAAAFDAARRLEELGRAADLPAAEQACGMLEDEMAQLRQHLERFLQAGT